MKDVGQSLAGRAAILSLLPFSFNEAVNGGQKTKTVGQILEKKLPAQKNLNSKT